MWLVNPGWLIDMNNLLARSFHLSTANVIGFQLLRVWQYDARMSQALKYRIHDRAYATKTLLPVRTNNNVVVTGTLTITGRREQSHSRPQLQSIRTFQNLLLFAGLRRREFCANNSKLKRTRTKHLTSNTIHSLVRTKSVNNPWWIIQIAWIRNRMIIYITFAFYVKVQFS